MPCPFRSRKSGFTAALGILILVAGGFLAAPAALRAAEPASAPASQPASAPASQPSEPAEVRVHIYVLEITNLNLRDNSFHLDCYLGFWWKDERLTPYKTYSLCNGTVDSSQLVVEKKNGASNFALVRLNATITQYYDLARFPLDSHTLKIVLEDHSKKASSLVYAANAGRSGMDPDLRIPGWTVQSPVPRVFTYTYQTNAKEKFLDYSRISFSMDIHRKGPLFACKILSGLYLSVLLAFVMLLVSADHRLGLLTGSVFAVIGSHTLISGILPDTGVLTLADKLHLLAVILIVLSVLETALSLSLLHKDKKQTATRLDRITLAVLVPVFTFFNIWLFWA